MPDIQTKAEVHQPVIVWVSNRYTGKPASFDGFYGQVTGQVEFVARQSSDVPPETGDKSVREGAIVPGCFVVSVDVFSDMSGAAL